MATPRPEREYVIDRLMDDYVDWREECNAVRQAYEHWSRVGLTDQALACAAYGAALDREETAARVYSVQHERSILG